MILTRIQGLEWFGRKITGVAIPTRTGGIISREGVRMKVIRVKKHKYAFGHCITLFDKIGFIVWKVFVDPDYILPVRWYQKYLFIGRVRTLKPHDEFQIRVLWFGIAIKIHKKRSEPLIHNET